MYLTVLILPLLGSLISGLFGRKIGTKGAQIVTTLSIIITTLISIILFIEVGINHIPVYIELFR
jgi:NADH-ubiquinone oxidoreductase chain 5